MKIAVLFYSTYGHNYLMAAAAAEGLKKSGIEVDLLRVPETLSEDILEKMGASEAQKTFEHIPLAEVDKLPEYDGFVFSFPTRFGNMPAQLKAFVDSTGGLWQTGALIGKPFGLIAGSATQHSGQESTLLTSMVPFLHHGMIFVGLPQSEAALFNSETVEGGSFYGATTVSAGDGSRMPSDTEKDIAAILAERVGKVAAKLAA